MHARKLPSGSWNVLALGSKGKDGKRATKSFTGEDLRFLKAQAAIWESKHRTVAGSFSSEADAFLKRRAAVLSPNTIRGYWAIKRQLDAFPALAKAPLHAIDGKLLDEVIAQMDAQPKTIKNRIAFISAVMRANKIEMPETVLPKVQKPELHIPEPDIVQQTIQAATGEMWIVIMLAATGPLREGEIAALSMEDIDFKRNIVHVHHSMALGPDMKYHKKGPKTAASDRYLVMPENLIQAIKEQGYVTKMTPKNIQDAFHRHLRDNNIPFYRFHDLRHFCISDLLAQGVAEIYVAERSGHADHASLQKYTHALALHREDVNKTVLSRFASISCDPACDPTVKEN